MPKGEVYPERVEKGFAEIIAGNVILTFRLANDSYARAVGRRSLNGCRGHHDYWVPPALFKRARQQATAILLAQKRKAEESPSKVMARNVDTLLEEYRQQREERRRAASQLSLFEAIV